MNGSLWDFQKLFQTKWQNVFESSATVGAGTVTA
jgi:hypothetical protein